MLYSKRSKQRIPSRNVTLTSRGLPRNMLRFESLNFFILLLAIHEREQSGICPPNARSELYSYYAKWTSKITSVPRYYQFRVTLPASGRYDIQLYPRVMKGKRNERKTQIFHTSLADEWRYVYILLASSSEVTDHSDEPFVVYFSFEGKMT
jgi:hypothetical protein